MHISITHNDFYMSILVNNIYIYFVKNWIPFVSFSSFRLSSLHNIIFCPVEFALTESSTAVVVVHLLSLSILIFTELVQESINQVI